MHDSKRAIFLVLGVLAFGNWRCGGNDSGIGNDCKPRTIEGGGTGDGPIEGRLNVTSIDDQTGKPLENVFVMLGLGPDPQFSDFSDAEGRVVFRDKAISGPQQVTVYKKGYTASTFFGLNAANLTVNLETIGSKQPDSATVTGRVTGFDKLPQAPQGSFQVAVVGYSVPDLFGEDVPKIEQPNPDDPANLVVPAAKNNVDTYSLLTWVGEQIIYAYGGMVTPTATGSAFDVTRFGMKTGVTTVKDQTASGVDVDLALEVNQPVSVNMGAAPAGMSKTAVMALLDLGDQGQIPMPGLKDADGNGIFDGKVPDLTGDLSRGVYDLIARAYNENCTGSGANAVCKDTRPNTMSVARDLTVAKLANYSFETLLAAPGSLAVDTKKMTFTFTRPDGADLMLGDLLEAGTENKLWTVALVGPGLSGFSLPELPASSGFAGLPQKVTWRQGAADLPASVDVNDIRFEDLGKKMVRMSSAEIEFSP